MEKKINYFIIIIAVVIATSIPTILRNTVFSPKVQINKALMQAADEINKNCPIMVDKETRLDNAITRIDNEFIYNYTLINVDESNFDKEQFLTIATPLVTNNFKTNPDTKKMFENGITVICRYKDKNAVFLAEITILPDN